MTAQERDSGGKKAGLGLQGSARYQGDPLRFRTVFSMGWSSQRSFINQYTQNLLSQQKSLCSWGEGLHLSE